MTIGICDYGIGGVSLYRRLRELSDVNVIYYSDTGFVPYGKVPEDELRVRVAKVVDFLFAAGADYVAVACNAASTVLPDRPNVAGIIGHGLTVVRNAEVAHVGVVGGFRTIRSNVYKTPLEREGIRVSQQVAQALSIRIEAGDLHSEALRGDVAAIFEPLSGCDAVLLACTHYPAISDTVRAVIPGVRLLDPLEDMVDFIRSNWQPLSGTRLERWITSGDTEKMRTAARAAFDVDLQTIQHLIV